MSPLAPRALCLLWMTPDVPSSLGGGTWVHLNLFNIPLSTCHKSPVLPQQRALWRLFLPLWGPLEKTVWDQTAWGGP